MNMPRWIHIVGICLGASYSYGQGAPLSCEGGGKSKVPKPIYKGVIYSRIPLPERYDGCAYFVTVNPATSVFRVLASGAGRTGSSRARYLGDYIGEQNAKIVVSGGYMSSFSPPKALGLVKVNGQLISSPHTTWLGAGMVCTDGGMPKIAKYDELKSTSLTDCLQSGPLLIDGGDVRYLKPDLDIDPGEKKLVNSEQNQAFICVAENKDIKLGVSDKIRLDDFSKFLKEKNELKCHDALRLTGHFTAGLQIGRDLYGNDEYPLPSVIAVAPKAKR
ncbi:MAG: phosphodiester glycosidase family protein [Nitrososphaera sp.]|nr:phosphodiester glycosidase family protein [Nitrososphaera sp.]